jgi:hypothetical protein
MLTFQLGTSECHVIVPVQAEQPDAGLSLGKALPWPPAPPAGTRRTEFHLLDAGHFAVEEQAVAIEQHGVRFMARLTP